MKKLLLLLTLCTSGLFAQSGELFVTGGAAIYRNPLTERFNVGIGLGHIFATPKVFDLVDEVTVGYNYTDSNTHMLLAGVKRTFATPVVNPFFEVGVGPTLFGNFNSNIIKVSTRFGAGLSRGLGKGVSLSLGIYGNKIQDVPVYISTVAGLSKRF